MSIDVATAIIIRDNFNAIVEEAAVENRLGAYGVKTDRGNHAEVYVSKGPNRPDVFVSKDFHENGKLFRTWLAVKEGNSEILLAQAVPWIDKSKKLYDGDFFIWLAGENDKDRPPY